jgi:hypothetical protein
VPLQQKQHWGWLTVQELLHCHAWGCWQLGQMLPAQML